MEEWSERCSVACLEGGGVGPQAKECGQPLETEKGKETESLLDSPKQERGRANSLMFCPLRLMLEF